MKDMKQSREVIRLSSRAAAALDELSQRTDVEFGDTIQKLNGLKRMAEYVEASGRGEFSRVMAAMREAR